MARLMGAKNAGAKVAEIRASLDADHRPSLGDLIDPATQRWRRIVWVGIGLAVFQQLVGINVVFYYGAVLWQAVGFSEADALKINILSGTLSILSCLLAIGLIDRIGRKPLLLAGSIGMAVTLAILTWCFSAGSFADGKLTLPDGVGTTALYAANIYVICFNFSWGPVM
jgi:MFS transporter, SP family, sugar:H+ symporter